MNCSVTLSSAGLLLSRTSTATVELPGTSKRPITYQWSSLILLVATLILFVFPVVAASTSHYPTDGFIEILTSNDRYMEFTVNSSGIREVSQKSDEAVFKGYIASFEANDSIPGLPVLPRYTLLVAIPPSGDVTITVSDEQISQKTVGGLLSWRSRVVTDNPIDTEYSTTPSTVNLPSIPVSLQRTVWFRGNRIAVIDVHPVLFNPNTREINRYEFMRIRVSFTGSSCNETADDHPAMAAVAAHLVMNPDSLKKFRSRGSDLKSHDSKAFECKNNRPEKRSPDNGWQVSVSQDGICRITEEIDFSGVDPRHISVYYLGEEIPIFVSGENDGTYDVGDYIEFPCKAFRNPDGTANKYTDTSVYRLIVGDYPGMRITTLDGSQPGAPPAADYRAIAGREENNLYSFGDYYWEPLRVQQPADFFVQVPFPTQSLNPCILRIRLKGVTSLQEIDPDHHIRAFWNENLVADRFWDGTDELVIEAPVAPAEILPGENTLRLIMPGDTVAGDVDSAFFDMLEIEYARQYRSQNERLMFSAPLNPEAGLVRYDITGFSNAQLSIYRIDTHQRVTGLSVFPVGQQFTVRFSDVADEDAVYHACSVDGYLPPASVSGWTDANLASPSNHADYIIITHPDFLDSLPPLANHLESRGLDVMTVRIDDIFNTFSDGIWDPEAIKDFCQYAYLNYSGNAPSYILLVGDSSWDYKMYLPGSRPVNFLPAYGKSWSESSFDPFDRGPYDSSDLLYGEPMVDDQYVCVSGDDNLPDMAIGRFPVRTTEQLRIAIEKIIAYDNQTRDQSWQKNLLFINGGVGDSEQDMFSDQSETIIKNLAEGSGQYYRISRIYKETDHREWGWYEDDILSKINSGQLFVNFLGHAGTWSWEAMLNFDDLNRIDNAGHLPIITSMTCNTARFANPMIDSFGEQFVFGQSVSGGAIAFWGGCNFGGYWSDYYMAYYFYSNALRNRVRPVGAIVLLTKLTTLTRYPGYSIIIEPYSLFGDPSMETNLPSGPIVHLAGYMDSHLSISDGGELTIAAFVTHPDGPARIAQVELMLNGQPTGLLLFDDGAHGDFGNGDGLYALFYSLPPQSFTNPASYLLEIEAMDIEGNRSQACPVLKSNN